MDVFYEGVVVKMKPEFAPLYHSADEGGFGILALYNNRYKEHLIEAMFSDEENRKVGDIYFDVNWGSGKHSRIKLSHIETVHPYDALYQCLKTRNNDCLIHKEDDDGIKIAIEEELDLVQVSDQLYEYELCGIIIELRKRKMQGERRPRIDGLIEKAEENLQLIQDYWHRD